MPDSLKQFNEKELLIGPVLKSPTAKLKRMRGNGEKYRDLELLRLEGDSATQYCMQSRDLILRMNQHCQLWVTSLEDGGGKLIFARGL